MLAQKKKICLGVIAVLIILFFIINTIIPPLIPIFQYRKNAIVLIIGDYGSFNDTDYTDEFLSIKFKEYWETRAEELKKSTNCEIYFCYEDVFNFQLSYFANLLVIINGHGSVSEYYNSHYIRINEQKKIYASEFQVRCSNLTLVISSCYSYSWYFDFHHKKLENLFTSDLCNNVSFFRYQYIPFEPYNNLTVQCYSRFFIDALLKNYSYQKANETAWINMTQFNLANC